MIKQLFSSRNALWTGLVWIGGAWIAAPIAKSGGPRGAHWTPRCSFRGRMVPSVFSGILFHKAARDIVRCQHLEIFIHCCLTVSIEDRRSRNYITSVHSGILREYDADSLVAAI